MVAYNQKVAHIQAVEGAVTNIKQCQRAVRRREYHLEERLEKLHKQKHKKSQYDKAVKQVKKYNQELAALDQAINHYNALTGNPERISTPKMKKPQRPSWDDRLASRLKDIGFESINVSASAPLYPTRTPQLTDRQTPHDAPPPPKPTEPTKPQPRKPAPETATPTINTTFQDVQALQRQKQFETNMAFTSTPQPLQPSAPIDWGRGVARKTQQAPLSTHQIRQSGLRPPEHTAPGMKRYPNIDRTPSNIPKWLRYFANGGEPLDPQERIDQNTQIFVAHTKALAKTFGEMADELRSFGCVNAKFDQGRVTLKFDRTVSDKLDQLVAQRLPRMDHIKHFRYVEFTASVANEVVLQTFLMPFFKAQKAGPLVDKALRPQRFQRELQSIQKLQRPPLHSGIGSPWSEMVPTHQVQRNTTAAEKAVTKLAERNVSKIKSCNTKAEGSRAKVTKEIRKGQVSTGARQVVVEPNKYNYIFGVVKKSDHNSARAAHNATQMHRLGITNSNEGRVILERHFNFVVQDSSNIVKKYSNEFGVYEIRESILSGPSGKFAKLESCFEILPDGSRRFITTIPKGG